MNKQIIKNAEKNSWKQTRTVVWKFLLAIVILMIPSILTGCSSDSFAGDGTYVSKTDNNRRIIFEKSKDLVLFNGTATYKDGEKETKCVFITSTIPLGTGVVLFDLENNDSEIIGFFVIDGELHETTSDEVFEKWGFIKLFWEDHKTGVIIFIIAWIVLGTILTIHEEKVKKFNEKTERLSEELSQKIDEKGDKIGEKIDNFFDKIF